MKMKNKIENVEKQKKGLTFSEFQEMWDKAEKFNIEFKKFEDCTVVDVNGSVIKADSYSVYWKDDHDSLIILFYHDYKIAEINLKYIKSVY